MGSKRIDLTAALESLPLFPLSQVVLFPMARLPLHVFEPRYRTMLADCLSSFGVMGIAMVPDPADVIDDRGHPRLARVAGVGFVAEHEPMQDGRSNIVLVGMERVRLEELPFEAPYRRAKATVLKSKETRVSDNDRAALVASATAFVRDVKRRQQDFDLELPPNLSAGALADLCAHHLVLSPEVRQAALEELDPAARVALVTRELGLQRASLSDSPRELN